LAFLAAFPEAAYAIDNTTPSPTVPATRYRSGLIKSPNPIDTSSNLIMTGNIRGGRYFRGVVPYRATTDFGDSVPSAMLDSFLRDSAGSEDFGRYTASQRPYYSPSATVATTSPGYTSIISPPATNLTGKTADRFPLPPPTNRQALSAAETQLSYRRLRPLAMTTQQLERVIAFELNQYMGTPKITEQLTDKTPQPQKSITSTDESLLLPTTKKPTSDVLKQFEQQRPTEKTAQPEQLDVYEKMKRQIYDLQKGLEQVPVTQQTIEAAQPSQETTKQATPESSQAQKLSETHLSAVRAKAIMGPHETFASFAMDKFNQHIRAAELYLKQGKFYRAADAYSIASLYKPDDPLAYAGKSHALFAAGEYMSSALFLARALELFPDYACLKIDLEAMVADRDKLETRVTDVKEWLEKTKAPEMNFLLAYVYHQMQRPINAKEAIDAAYEKMPDSPAVIALKKAIDEYSTAE
jgi:tetratricopeptide (TPR) repeat protein